MSKYIDAEKLIAEIERLKEETPIGICEYEKGEENGRMEVLTSLQSTIASLQQAQPDNMIQWTGNNLKEVIDFTGKSPRFEEWFKSWEEFETYVHQHNDILKLFCEDGSHYEVPKGAWIVKSPDGYNLPSVAKYIQQPAEWSEEDELFLGVCKNALSKYERSDKWDASIISVWLENRLKSLRSMPKQEQPEVDLEKEINKFLNESGFPCFWCNDDEQKEWCGVIACHFYELGKNSK